MSVRFGFYVHSDAVTPNKGAALAAVTADGGFARTAARFAYGAGAGRWDDVTALFNDAEAARRAAGADVPRVAVVRLGRGEAGRVEVAVGDKRAVAVKVVATTDFAAKTDAFKAFAADAAAAALRHGAGSWDGLVAVEPELEQARTSLAGDLKEKVEVVEVVSLSM